MTPPHRPLTRRAVAVAGHVGDVGTATQGLTSDDPGIRATALGAMERLGELDDATLVIALSDAAAAVRRRAAELAARHPGVDLVPTLHDPDTTVVEMACWACGEHESDRAAVVDTLIELASGADDALVREAAVAALGAIGAPQAVATIIRATEDKPAVRRRAIRGFTPRFVEHNFLGSLVVNLFVSKEASHTILYGSFPSDTE